ncbi:uncharacterized protein LOC110723392 [Chenopodium quinoa]|uniref:uncharacterized protein LOC110723392 n=1 Tax=Chenopodium quinoa TaxID=63459 RepID=UPI000B776185|nr:uncharacterized protein LOC110723392 [Chenopodium quinoa]
MSGGGRRGPQRGGGRRGGASRGGARSGDVEEVVIETSAGNDASDGCRPRKVSADVFRDNSLSEGGKMKELGTVIERCSMELKWPENVNCRVESFGATISKFDEDK